VQKNIDAFSKDVIWKGGCRNCCQSFSVGARRSFAVIATSSAREAAFIFRIIRPLCAFTVISLMQHQTFGD
jgi:hypothetical protein